MRFLLATLLTAALSFIAGMYLPWYSLAIVSFLVALLIKQRIGFAYLSGFTAIFVLWFSLAALFHSLNHGVLTERVATIFRLQSNPLQLIFITALVGGIVAGFAAMSGSSISPFARKVANDRR